LKANLSFKQSGFQFVDILGAKTIELELKICMVISRKVIKIIQLF